MDDRINSKKLWFSVGAIVIAFVYCGLAATVWPSLVPMLPSFTGVLEFVTGAYLVGNVANKLVVAKGASQPSGQETL